MLEDLYSLKKNWWYAGLLVLLVLSFFTLLLSGCQTWQQKDRYYIGPENKQPSHVKGHLRPTSLQGLVPERVWSVYRHMSDESDMMIPPLIIFEPDSDLPKPEPKTT